jgi:hypothetical protein
MIHSFGYKLHQLCPTIPGWTISVCNIDESHKRGQGVLVHALDLKKIKEARRTI